MFFFTLLIGVFILEKPVDRKLKNNFILLTETGKLQLILKIKTSPSCHKYISNVQNIFFDLKHLSCG